jgi:primosomal protein N''
MGHLVNWFQNGRDVKRAAEGASGGRIVSEEFFFMPSLSWTKVSSGLFAVRYYDQGYLFDVAGPGVFCEDGKILYYCALLNSRINHPCLQQLSPTINYEGGQVSAFPIVAVKNGVDIVSENAKQNIAIARADWDSFETSWDFLDLPLLREGIKRDTLMESWETWRDRCVATIRRMQELETENNRLFIDAYGLQDELTPEVPEDQIILARPDRRKDVATFLSYAVGCMMGRYSLETPGLILANAEDTLEQYLAKVGKPLDQLTFTPDEDGIIPVLDGEWFEDDIVARTRDFLRATFGDATLETNLHFIEESLGKDLRKYFLTDFYRDHLQTYKKRPIYWLFQSPKKGFSALVYLHRYTKDTPNRLLSSYLRDYLHKLRAHLEHLDHLMASESTPAREVTKARKESEQLKKTLRECEDYEREILLPLAQKRIELDLDDGVKVNYLKLGEALATIPGLAAKEDD